MTRPNPIEKIVTSGCDASSHAINCEPALIKVHLSVCTISASTFFIQVKVSVLLGLDHLIGQNISVLEWQIFKGGDQMLLCVTFKIVVILGWKKSCSFIGKGFFRRRGCIAPLQMFAPP